MNVWIFDASVVVKWFMPEVYSTEARRWRTVADEKHIPDFFEVEIANTLWKKVIRAEIQRIDAEAILAMLPLLPVIRHPSRLLLMAALALANKTQRSVYDCLYLALAVRLGGQMVTADQRLFNSLAATPLAGSIRRVEDVP